MEGAHEGRPYGGWMGWWSSNGFVGMGVWFPNHPYGNSGLDGDDRWRVRGMGFRPREKNGSWRDEFLRVGPHGAK